MGPPSRVTPMLGHDDAWTFKVRRSTQARHVLEVPCALLCSTPLCLTCVAAGSLHRLGRRAVPAQPPGQSGKSAGGRP